MNGMKNNAPELGGNDTGRSNQKNLLKQHVGYRVIALRFVCVIRPFCRSVFGPYICARFSLFFGGKFCAVWRFYLKGCDTIPFAKFHSIAGWNGITSGR